MKDITPILSLLNALSDPREGLRQFAIQRLVKLGREAVPFLIGALKNKNPLVQESVAIALVTIGGDAVPALLAAMQHQDREMRWTAAWVMSAMPEEFRRALPQVNLPVAQETQPAAVAAAASGLHGVWSDSWLTKVRERLEANKVVDVLNLAAQQPLRPATT